MHIISFSASIIFLVAYLFSTILLFNKDNSDAKFDFRNHFAYELFIKKDRNNFVLNLLLLLSALLFTLNFILFAVSYFNVINLVSAIFSVIISFSLMVLFYLPLNKLRERCIFSIIFAVAITMLNALLVFQSVNMIKQLEEKLVLIPIVVNALILIIGIFTIFNPQLFNFDMKRNEDGTLERPKYITLAFFEWLLILSFLFSQIYIVMFPLLK